MVLAAALISLAALVPPADPQSAAPKPPLPQSTASDDTSKPYSVEGVRSAYDANARPRIDLAPTAPNRQGSGISIVWSAASDDPCSLVVTGCQPAWRGGVNPTWHDQFVGMVGPQNYMVPYSGMNNVQTLQAVASSIAINLALQAVVSLIYDQVVKSNDNRKQKKVEKIRAEIRGELAELERLNAAPIR
jgi:hypothetical protein